MLACYAIFCSIVSIEGGLAGWLSLRLKQRTRNRHAALEKKQVCVVVVVVVGPTTVHSYHCSSARSLRCNNEGRDTKKAGSRSTVQYKQQFSPILQYIHCCLSQAARSLFRCCHDRARLVFTTSERNLAAVAAHAAAKMIHGGGWMRMIE